MYKYFLILTLLIAGTALGQWTEPELFPVAHGNAIQGPWISNDDMRMYAAFSGYIFVSERVRPGGSWQPFHNVNNHVNGALRQESPCESPSGDTLYFMVDGREPCYGSYDIYYTIRTDTGWFGPIYNCGPNINSQYREWSVGISRDGSKLLITSDRIPGGTMNLYYSDKQSDGSWDTLVNFGPNINTWRDEEHASLSIDNQRLVFYKVGPRHGDIWISELVDSVWSTATYIQEPVTTQDWTESDPCFGPDGRTLYFISDRDAHPYGTQLYVTEDTTVSAVDPRPAIPQQVEPALFGRVQDQRLRLVLVGGGRSGDYELRLYDVLGRLVQQAMIEMMLDESALRGDFALPDLSSGVYIADLQNRQMHLSTRFTITR
jgi:hypothetical protein